VLSRFGLGLWTLRSTAFHPRNRAGALRAFVDDAVLAERLGFHSIWTAEHRHWYDGWAPAPLHAQAAAIAATTTLRFSHAVMLLAQHDAVALGRALATFDRLSGGRVELGAGLGHRDLEFYAHGRRRRRRGALMDEGLDTLARVWAGEFGDAPPLQCPGPPIWIGGLAPPALERAARGGHNLMLPQTLRPSELARTIEQLRGTDPAPARIGTLRDVWLEPDPARAARMRRTHELHFTEEAGFWILRGTPAYDVPELLAKQLRRVTGSALIGGADEVAGGLRALFEAGAELVVLRIQFDMASHTEIREQIHRLAELLPPRLGDLRVVA
jgi:alkanesulfonate monooxygenase SsuD/methylene tetrahydromethanopterin reductase-like flavin-dependent oxidoreductase (luciferase family)